MVPSLPLLSCELSVSVKENPDRKKNKTFRIAFESKTLGQRWAEFGVKKHVMLCDFKLDTMTYSYKQPFF